MLRQVHRHPLSLDSICCVDHAYELCVYLQKHARDEEVIFALLSTLELVDGTYLGDLSAQAQGRKRTLIALANEYSLYCGNSGSLDVAANLLGVAETLLSGLQQDDEAEGLHVTTLLNLAFLCCKEGNLPKALEALEEADKSDQKRKDLISHATVKISLSSVLIQMENFEEGHAQAQAAFRLLEEEQQRTHEFTSQKLRGLMLAAKLSLTSASERLYDAKSGSQLYDLKTSLIECVESKPQDKMREYDGSPIQPITRRSGRKVTAASTMAEDFRSFCERVQGWEKDKPIENPSFLKDGETPPKTTQRLPVPARSPRSNHERPLLRMPNSQLPQIPLRSFALKHRDIGLFPRVKSVTDYKRLLMQRLSERTETMRTTRVVDEAVYTVQWTANQSISVFSASTPQGNNPPDESLSTEDLCKLLDLLYLEDTAPKYLKAGLSLSLSDFARFCVFPYLQISPISKKASKRLEFWSFAPSLLPSLSSKVVSGKKKRLTVHQISEWMVRVTLAEICNAPKAENSLYFEVQFDTETMKKVCITEENTGLVQEIKPEFASLLEPAFEEIAKMTKTGRQFLLIRVLVSSDSPYLILHFLRDHPSSRTLEIDTVTTSKQHSIEAVYLSYVQLVSKFGLPLKETTTEVRELISGFILDSVIVERIIDSNDMLVRLAQCEEVTGHRAFMTLGTQLVPVTLTLMGVKTRIIGVKAVAWDAVKTVEMGVMWYADSRNYRNTLENSGASQSRKKKKLEKADRLSEMAEKETSLVTLLEERMGWETLLQALSLGQGPSPNLRIQSPAGDLVRLARLEVYLPPI